ncbi:MAG: hypothetical protein AAGA56_13430, partial [Myxococcota bacterium]
VNLKKASVKIEEQLIVSCREIGLAIGLSEDQLTAEPAGGDGAKKVCDPVIAEMGKIIEASGELAISFTEPRCELPVDVLNGCFGGCNAKVEPGELSAACEGGEISGTCEGTCEGSCRVEAAAECGGSCDGRCDGECEGSTDAGGKCDGTCKGSCSGTCTTEGQADCKGSCSGNCSGELEAPTCSGTFKPPTVDPNCYIQCASEAALQVKCFPPGVTIAAKGEANSNLDGLIKGLYKGLPKVLEIQVATAKDIAAQLTVVTKAVVEAKSSLSSAGPQAIMCMTGAAGLAGDATASLEANVSISASVSGKAGASTEG